MPRKNKRKRDNHSASTHANDDESFDTFQPNPYSKVRLASSLGTTASGGQLLRTEHDPFATRERKGKGKQVTMDTKQEKRARKENVRAEKVAKEEKVKASLDGELAPNWAAFRAQSKPQRTISRIQIKDSVDVEDNQDESRLSIFINGLDHVGSVVAIDCEMVGAGAHGKRSILARVAVVDTSGTVIIDSFVQPMEYVTDFRTAVSGIRPSDLVNASKGGEALPFKTVQTAVAEILNGRIVVGHAIRNDLNALMLDHPKELIRDTSKYVPLMRRKRDGTDAAAGKYKYKPKSLKELASSELGAEIQTGEHSPVVDARATMSLYQKHRDKWESELKMKSKAKPKPRNKSRSKKQ